MEIASDIGAKFPVAKMPGPKGNVVGEGQALLAAGTLAGHLSVSAGGFLHECSDLGHAREMAR